MQPPASHALQSAVSANQVLADPSDDSERVHAPGVDASCALWLTAKRRGHLCLSMFLVLLLKRICSAGSLAKHLAVFINFLRWILLAPDHCALLPYSISKLPMSAQPFWYSTGEAPTVDPLLTISPGNSGYTAPPPTCVAILQQTPPYSDRHPTQRPDGTVSIPLPDDTDLKFIYPIEVQGHSGPLGGMMLAHWGKPAPDVPAPAAKWAPQTGELIPESAQFVYVRGTSVSLFTSLALKLVFELAYVALLREQAEGEMLHPCGAAHVRGSAHALRKGTA